MYFINFIYSFCYYFSVDTSKTGESLCKSFLDVYESKDLYDKFGIYRREFVRSFADLNLLLFQMNMHECVENYIREELKRESEEAEATLSSLSKDSVLSHSDEDSFELDLSQFVSPRQDTDLLATNPCFLSIKLSDAKTIRVVSESEFNYLKERFNSLQDSLDHFVDQFTSVTGRIQEEELEVPEGKWLPTDSNSDDPIDREQVWRSGKVYDRRGHKWFVSSKDIWNAAKNMALPDTFRKFLFSVFTKNVIQSFTKVDEFPEQLKLACTELLGEFSI